MGRHRRRRLKPEEKSRGCEQFIHYTSERGEISHNSVSCITTDNKNRLWIGTWGLGLNIMDLKEPYRVQEIMFMDPDTNFMFYFIATLIYDPINNGMWIGADIGLFSTT